jgi:ABC-type sugar transport system permease subunit
MGDLALVEKLRLHRARRRRETASLLVFLLPVLFFVVVFLAFPLLSSGYISLTDIRGNLFAPHTFIGLSGYFATFRDSFFLDALRNQAAYAGAYFLLTFTVSLGLATLLNEIRWGSDALQVVFYLPMIIPLSIVGGIFMWILSGTNTGFLNIVLNRAGLGRVPPLNVYGDPRFALLGLVVARSWKTTGFTLIIFLAGFKGIPREIREAAGLSGATFFQELRYVILPMLRPYLLIGATWILINSMKEFDLPAVVTFGGPGTATLTLYYRSWSLAFEYWQMGRSSQVAYVTAFLILGLSVILNRVFRTEGGQRA